MNVTQVVRPIYSAGHTNAGQAARELRDLAARVERGEIETLFMGWEDEDTINWRWYLGQLSKVIYLLRIAEHNLISRHAFMEEE